MFVRRVQEALSVARVQGNGWVWKKGLQAVAYMGVGTASRRAMIGPLMMWDEVYTCIDP